MPANPEISRGRPKTTKRRRKTDKNSPKTGESEIRRTQRMARFLDMRLQGWSHRQIGEAETPKLTATRVGQIIEEALKKTLKEPSENIRAIEDMRLDEMLLALYPNALKGDPIAVDRVLAIMARRAALYGLNAPTKVEQSGPNGAPMQTEVQINDAAAAFDVKVAKARASAAAARDAQSAAANIAAGPDGGAGPGSGDGVAGEPVPGGEG